MEADFLKQLLIVLSATIAIVYLFQKLRLPAIVGFLLAGLLIGPNGAALIEGFDHIELLAEIGVALLLFTIGIEFSLAALMAVPHRVIWAGLLQIVFTVVAVAALARMLGAPPPQALFFGFLIALSSTAIVLRIYHERGALHSLHGRAVSGVLFLQDLSIVPMMLLVPVLGRSESASLWDVLWASLQAIAALLAIVFVARKLLPRLLHHVAVLKNREIFILFVLWICLGTAWLTAQTGLSLALGALVAGLVISESELSHQIVADVLPLRDCFSGIFFISIGMLLDLNALRSDWLGAATQFLVIVTVKGIIAFVAFWVFYRSLNMAAILGFSLAQVGEFSFVLAQAGLRFDLLSGKDEQMFLAAAILSMIATPWLIQAGHRLARGPRWGAATQDLPPGGNGQADSAPGRGHVIVVGYGVNGKNLARVLKEVAIPHRILELDPDLVQAATAADETIIFGDAARPEILHQAGLASARVLVIAISDPSATARIVAQTRRLRPELYIIVRTRYVAEIEHLYRVGADEVIPEEFETSIEIFARVLDRFHIPRNLISLQVEMIRQGHYGTLRGLRFQGKRLDELNRFLVGVTADIFMILDGSPALDQNFAEIDLHNRSGATVIAAVRDGQYFYSFDADFRLRVDDMLVLLGAHKALDDAGQILKPATETGSSE